MKLTDAEVRAIAKAAGFWGVDTWWKQSIPQFRAVLAQGMKEERERCAKVCDELERTGIPFRGHLINVAHADDCAAAIRAQPIEGEGK